jgi:hypothetical protein
LLELSGPQEYKAIMSTRALRQLICRMLIAVVAFVHTAVAAYGCSRMPGTPTAVQMQATLLSDGLEAAPMVGARLAGPGDMVQGDRGATHMNAGLCAAHCQVGNQSADRAPAPTANPVLLALLYTIEPAAQAAGQAARPASPTQGAPPAPDPPQTILHCCLRD